MDSAFQIEAITDRQDASGKPIRRLYAATTTTAEQALELARSELPSAWQVRVVDGFKYGLQVVRDAGLEPNSIGWVE